MTTPRRFAVLGDPIGHSKSPIMHAAAYRALRMPHTYEAIRAKPEDLPDLIAKLRDHVYGGFNVTVPHKKRILDYVDVVDASAAIGTAANTIVRREDGTVVGYNTDAPALAVELKRLAPDVDFPRAQALVLGMGGAARSAIVALAVELRVRRVVVRGRSDGASLGDIAQLLAAAGSKTELRIEPFAASQATEAETLLVLQATSAGMLGASPGEDVAKVVAWEDLPARAAALDVIYAPPETPFLRRAAASGIRSANGIGMLVGQGALAFELWLGVPAPYNAMVAALV